MTGSTPPPPGDTREQLPDHLLALIDVPLYVSTACEAADRLTEAITVHPGHADELRQWSDRMHARCRINNKYTGQLCRYPCHLRADTAHALDSR
ncbi:hypothetical protein [Streptomyces spectabilis]|uniref:Uncharacterized protein n=1 Tax=Streptomyces spectabilis TaxID=68270 RepID=A0A5P2X6E3_STRST|nr:hypothetical protein [Streptomyces spectabilis]MBB5108351.1 hypothetical protein [Streptomyces spectabilis]MCI3901108.1 hypothetical protein [Streptomyces spectabilis]QEV58600.1 hypothetical protein CP982_07615 [Streptomyces spectabilis]GGV46002.1 hypothetical protein GCM10010245_72130 [Streptomyces spectabilis]